MSLGGPALRAVLSPAPHIDVPNPPRPMWRITLGQNGAKSSKQAALEHE